VKQPLRDLIGEFEVEQRHALARRISEWARLKGRSHYVADHGEATRDEDEGVPAMGDHWPTYSELVDANGDDCDGVDLIAYQLLREFGFAKDQLFRAILMRDRDRVNHMVTLWFEDPGDPWVFDATGAATRELVRFSKVEGWTPTHIFNETAQYTVVKLDAANPRDKGQPFATLSRGLSPR
jgi:predicted transglutaminase-like cysteine proteinase